MKRFLKTGFCALALMLSTTAAHAITCAGVEARVNSRTSSLQASVLATIQTRQAALVAQELLERQRLLSAVKVLTMQMAQSSQQEIVSNLAVSKAMGQTIVEQSIADQTREAIRDYGNTGFNACGLVEAGYRVDEALNTADTARGAITTEIAERHAIRTREDYDRESQRWFEEAQSGDAPSAAALFSGDADEARRYISMVMGPPRAPRADEGVGGSIDRAIALRDIARQSVTAYVLAEIASSQRVEVALRDMTREWLGEDGGEAWFATQAASPARAVLLDTARIEAANVAMKANSVRRVMLEEMALSTFALAYADRLTEGGN
ncbi:hypothetical protein [Pseudogemmobacter faecipullorum]|uniref:PilJ/NarX-like methyl-accepting chemotaxis transducer n=1 Tax=Pseudogemmobacter faecipullorum TaxID=2755041 RepID=A0ABS8CQR5_9RHOB|nr:hypothetical protein [Pseudogemmobacter faecipullorum]MCB5411717.1 hypothetical protein [Pseudogemmobacter faecipullorum]